MATPAQEKVVADILSSGGDLAQLLGIDDKSGFDEIKKRYRKLVLLVHPDKNKAEDAKKAFQLLQTTFDQAEAYLKLRDRQEKVDATATVHTQKERSKPATSEPTKSAATPQASSASSGGGGSGGTSSTGAFFFSCPKCNQRLRTFTAYVEMQLSCLGCGHAFKIRQTEQPSNSPSQRGQTGVRFEANSSQVQDDSDLSDDSFFDSSEDESSPAAAPPPQQQQHQQNQYPGVPLPPDENTTAQQSQSDPSNEPKPKTTSCWICHKCTQLNLPKKTKCSMCSTPRRKSKPRATKVKPQFSSGDDVEVRLADGTWTAANVASVEIKKQYYTLQSGKKVSFASVRVPTPKHQQQVFKIGESVEVMRSKGNWSTCTIVAVDVAGSLYTVKGNENGFEWTKSISFSSLSVRRLSSSPTTQSKSTGNVFKLYDEVEVRRQNGLWTTCSITSIDNTSGLYTVTGKSDDGVEWMKCVTFISPSIRKPSFESHPSPPSSPTTTSRGPSSFSVGDDVEVLRQNGVWAPCVVKNIDKSAGLYTVQGINEGIEWTKGLAFISPAIRHPQNKPQQQQQQQQQPRHQPEPTPTPAPAAEKVYRPKPPKASATKPWHCSNCTLPNKAKAIKCIMCGTRKQKTSILSEVDTTVSEDKQPADGIFSVGSEQLPARKSSDVAATDPGEVKQPAATTLKSTEPQQQRQKEDEDYCFKPPPSVTPTPTPTTPTTATTPTAPAASSESLSEMKQRIRDELRAEMQREFEAEKTQELEALRKQKETEVEQLKAETRQREDALTQLKEAEANAEREAHEKQLHDLRLAKELTEKENVQKETEVQNKLQELTRQNDEINEKLKSQELEVQTIHEQKTKEKEEAVAQISKTKEIELLDKQKEVEETISRLKADKDKEAAVEKASALAEAHRQESDQREREIAALMQASEEEVQHVKVSKEREKEVELARLEEEKANALAEAHRQESEQRELEITALKADKEKEKETEVARLEEEKADALAEARRQETEQREREISALKKASEEEVQHLKADNEKEKEAEITQLRQQQQQELDSLRAIKEQEEEAKLRKKEEEIEILRKRKESELEQAKQQIADEITNGQAATAEQLSRVNTLEEQLSHLSTENIRKAHAVAQLASKVQQHEEDAASFAQRKKDLAQREREEARKAVMRDAEEKIRIERDKRKAKEESTRLRRDAAKERLKSEIDSITRATAGAEKSKIQTAEEKEFIAASLRHKRILESQLQDTERQIEEQNEREQKLQQLMEESATSYAKLQESKQTIESEASTEQSRLKYLLTQTEELLEQERACAAFFAEQIQAEHTLKKTQLKKTEKHAASEFAMQMQQAESEGAKIMRAEYEQQLREVQAALAEEKECAEFFAQQLTEQRKQQKKFDELMTRLEEEKSCAEFFASEISGERNQRLELEEKLLTAEETAALSKISAGEQTAGLQEALNNVVAERLTEVASLKGEVQVLENKLSAAHSDGKNLEKKNILLQKQKQQQPSIIRVEVVGQQGQTAAVQSQPQPPPSQLDSNEEGIQEQVEAPHQEPILPAVVSSIQKKADTDFSSLPDLGQLSNENRSQPPPPPPPVGRKETHSESLPFDSDSSDEEDGLYLLQKRREEQRKKVEIPPCPFPDSDGESPLKFDPTRRSGVDGMKTRSGRGLFRCPSCDVGFPEELSSIDLPATCPACSHLFLLLSSMLVMTCEDDQKREDRKFAFGRDFGGPSFEEKKRRILAESGRQEDLFMVGKCTEGKEEDTYHDKKERVLNRAALGSKSETADQQIKREKQLLGAQMCNCGIARLGYCIHCNNEIKADITLDTTPSVGLCPCGASEMGKCLFCD